MKKTISSLMAAGIAAVSISVFPTVSAATLLNTDFESGIDGWTGRGGAVVELNSGSSASGEKSASVTGRSDAWNGISHALGSDICQPGKTYSFSAMVSQTDSLAAVHFKLSLEYSTGSGNNPGGDFPFPGFDIGGGSKTYDCIAEADAAAGMWTKLSNPSYTIPADATNVVLYIETEDSTVDFLVDDIIITDEGEAPPSGSLRGDVNKDGKVDNKDANDLVTYLLKGEGDISYENSDLNSNQMIEAEDLSILKQILMAPKPVETTAPPQQTSPQVQTTTPPVETTPPQETTTPVVETTPPDQPGQHMSAKEYMQKVAATVTQNVPGNAKGADTGKTEHFEYMSQKAGHNKGAYVWLPAGYSPDKKYNVMYMNHGIFGDESSMLTGFNVREMASSLIASGEAEPFIIIFTQMYTDPGTQGSPGFNITMDVMDKYDDFVFDLKDSLMPYVEEHWSVMTGREHTAIAGFSMGGRESLYCGMMLSDRIGYVCASSPAPGIVPASDSFLSNHLGSYNLERTKRLTEADFKYSDSDLPYLLMIAGGTNDGVVGTFPKQYHELYDKNGTMNIWMEVAGGGHDGGVGTPIFYNFFKNVFKA